MSNNQIEQIKQFLHSEICERRDYSASKMCEEVLKFLSHLSKEKNNGAGTMTMNNNPDEQAMIDYDQHIMEYNAMEEESEINDIIEMQLLNDMTDEQRAMVQLVSVLDDIQSMMHELALDERNELIDELTVLYERYNVYVQSRMGGQHE